MQLHSGSQKSRSEVVESYGMAVVQLRSITMRLYCIAALTIAMYHAWGVHVVDAGDLDMNTVSSVHAPENGCCT